MQSSLLAAWAAEWKQRSCKASYDELLVFKYSSFTYKMLGECSYDEKNRLVANLMAKFMVSHSPYLIMLSESSGKIQNGEILSPHKITLYSTGHTQTTHLLTQTHN